MFKIYSINKVYLDRPCTNASTSTYHNIKFSQLKMNLHIENLKKFHRLGLLDVLASVPTEYSKFVKQLFIHFGVQ